MRREYEKENVMRSAEFDRETVLRAAIGAFIAKGYNKTSMQDLKRATGLHPGSIYCAFENKQGLLLAALEQYEKDKTKEFSQHFEGREKILDGLKSYLSHLVENCGESSGHKVCLSQRALHELAEQEPLVESFINKNLNRWQDGFQTVFEKALENGELNNDRTPLQRVQSLIMGIYGLRTYAQTHPKADVIESLAEQLFEDVCL